MKPVLTIIIILGVIFGSIFGLKSYEPSTKFYNRAGLINKTIKIWNDTIAVTSATPSVNISSAGFSTIVSVQPQIIQASPTLATFSWCNVTSFTTSAVTFFLAQQNNSSVVILGINVLSGTPLAAPTSFSGMFLAVQVIGY